MTQLRRLWPYVARYRRALLFGAVLVVGKTFAMLQIPGLARQGIDAIHQHAGMAPVVSIVVWMLVYGLLFWVLTFGMRMVIVGASRKMEFDLRNDFFAHLQTLSPSYYDRHHSGDLVTRSNSDINQVRELLGPGIMYPLEVGVLVPPALVLMARIDPLLTSMTLVPLLLVFVSAKVWTAKLRVLFYAVQEQMSAMSSMVEENLSGIRVVKAYTREAGEIERFREVSREFLERNLTLARLEALIFPSLLFLAQLGSVIVLVVGGIGVIRHLGSGGGITLGQLGEFLLLLGMLTMPMMAFGWVLNVWQRGIASLDRIAAVLDERPLIALPPAPVCAEDIEGRIEARNLTFTYPGTDRAVLQDVTFSIEAGKTLALVGHTGSGKSTLVQLLLRLYPVGRGMLFVDGVDINDFDPVALRRRIGYVAQEPFLFAAPLVENICFGLEREDEALALALARRVDLESDVAGFPEGIRTRVGERGVTLSGGQRQRTALARALAVAPRILVLDDAFSAVDTHTEDVVLGHLRAERGAHTTVLIAHRISTVMAADRIVVLRDGRVVEQGTHAALLDHDGEYARICREQMLSEEIEREQ